MSKFIAIYLRVSTDKQTTKSQEPDLQHWAAGNADGRDVRYFRDAASGKTMNRPEWQKLESAIDAGQVDTLVCWRMDRLGRTASGLTALFEKLNDRNVNLISVRDSVDLSTPAGRLIANVLASVSAYETEVRGERVRAGQDAARAAGKTWGGSEKGRRLKVTAEAEEIIRRMHSEGHSKASMVRATQLSRRTVYRVIDSLESAPAHVKISR